MLNRYKTSNQATNQSIKQSVNCSNQLIVVHIKQTCKQDQLKPNKKRSVQKHHEQLISTTEGTAVNEADRGIVTI